MTTLRPDHLIKTYRSLLAGGGRSGRPLSPTTVRTVHRILSKALGDAVRDGVLARNPAAKVLLPKAVKPELQVWNRAQVATFLPYAAQDRLYATWLLALLCGLRRGELAGLRWADVDLERGTVRIRPLVGMYREAGRRARRMASQLRVGLHCFSFVGDTSQEAADDFYPGWAQMFTKIGKERGFGAPVRAQYDQMCEPDGAFLIGDPDTVAARALRIDRDLGGISRLSLQMTNVRLEHGNLLRGIELLGTGVAPRVLQALPGRARTPYGRRDDSRDAAPTGPHPRERGRRLLP